MTTAIYSKNATQSAIQVNGVDAVVIDANGITSGAPISLRNRIINGAMTIDQRNVGAAVTPTATNYTVDRWTTYVSQASKLTFQQVVDAPAGFSNSMKITVVASTAIAAGDNCGYRQPIEASNVTDFQFGLATAQPIVLSFLVKASVPGTYSGSLRNSGNTRSFPFSYVATTTWALVKILIPGETTGTWAVGGTGLGLDLWLDLGTGATYKSTAGSWQAGNFVGVTGSTNFVSQANGSTMNITGVQLELGTVATTFEQRPYGLELALCQRYYAKTYAQGATPGSVSSLGSLFSSNPAANNYPNLGTWTYPVVMRATPTLTTYATSTGAINSFTGDGVIYTPIGTANIGDRACSLFGNNVVVSATVFMAVHVTASAEL